MHTSICFNSKNYLYLKSHITTLQCQEPTACVYICVLIARRNASVALLDDFWEDMSTQMGKKRGFEATGANAVPSRKKWKSSDVVMSPSLI